MYKQIRSGTIRKFLKNGKRSKTGCVTTTSTCAGRWILPAPRPCRFWSGRRSSGLPAPDAATAAGAGKISYYLALTCGALQASIGQVSHLPVLRLAPVKENRSNCPFLTENHCAIHDAEPLVCALYPLAQEISREGQVSYFLQPTGCGGQVIEARVQDYLSRYDVPAREALDVRWALTCMELEDEVERLEAVLSPVLLRRAQAKLWQALYYHYDYAQPWLPQLEANLHGLKADWAKLTAYQQKQNVQSK